MEKDKQKIRVSQKAVIFREDGKILTMRRTKMAPSRPLHWDLPGGDLDFGENVRDGILREIKEEAGLEVQDLALLDVISAINDRGKFWVTIGYTAKAKTTKVILSNEHDDFRWIMPDEFQELKASPKNKKFIETFKLLRIRK
ncbi:MAG: NUDIX hydrolase [Candidatus Omnitrophica bacterium]|nr:NUDIX hydrolase [Candidatus Omnitrophota bacterium]MBU1924345.1 NUDIX hydrolase [Candidatus Omnitrophota bacterium]MBU2028374.1 NUDIX hydrolase [Patescibacteria group bacterium]